MRCSMPEAACTPSRNQWLCVSLMVGLCAPHNLEGSLLPDALLWLLYPVKAAGIVGRKLTLAFSKLST
jgi:hypothetical protein